jgi:hypothetical protein
MLVLPTYHFDIVLTDLGELCPETQSKVQGKRRFVARRYLQHNY